MDLTLDQHLLILNLLVGVGLPTLVGLVTKSTTNSGLKAVLLAALAAATGVVSSAIIALNAGVDFDVTTAGLNALGAWVTGIAAHYGLWKPTGASAALQNVGTNGRHEA